MPARTIAYTRVLREEQRADRQLDNLKTARLPPAPEGEGLPSQQ